MNRKIHVSTMLAILLMVSLLLLFLVAALCTAGVPLGMNFAEDAAKFQTLLTTLSGMILCLILTFILVLALHRHRISR